MMHYGFGKPSEDVLDGVAERSILQAIRFGPWCGPFLPGRVSPPSSRGVAAHRVIRRRDPAVLPGTGHRVPAILPGTRLPRRTVLLIQRPARGRLPTKAAALPTGRAARQPGHRQPRAEDRQANRSHPGAGVTRVGTGPRPARRAHPRNQDPQVPGRQRRRSRYRAERGGPGRTRHPAAPEGTRY
jgi:hypothetical protein